jgi:O-antigen biosynthesis protein
MQSFDNRKAEGMTGDEVVRDLLMSISRRSMFWTLERQAPSAWVEHVPLAFWLVDALRPCRIVELGTHNGVSYSAMCQAVKMLGLATSCFAIDTWKGDEHASFYSEDVYRDFTAFHDPRYGAFSRLVRSTFDEALGHFEDGSIDLLHIDGLHTYDAVRHDYESWLPKLSANAVVLFHDTNVRERNFGVFRLWNEITAGRLHFSFLHGHGLGVLGHGQDYPATLHALFSASEDGRLVSLIRETFANLGHSVRILSEKPLLDQLLSQHTSELGRLREILAAREAELTSFKEERAQNAGETGKLRGMLAACEAELARFKEERAQNAGEIGKLREMLAAREAELADFKEERAQNAGETSTLRRMLAAQEDKVTGLKHEFMQSASEIDKLREALAARNGEIARFKEERARNAGEIDGLREALSARNGEIMSLERRLTGSTAEVDSLSQTLSLRDREIEENAGRHAQLDRILASYSWRITRPWRFAGRVLRGEWHLVLAGLRLRIAHPMVSLAYRMAGPPTKGEQSCEVWREETRSSQPVLTAVAQKESCLPERNAGWVLVADDFLPLYDQQSGGLRLKTLIDIIGEQGWPMVFASRFPRSELPGVLSTEAGIAQYEAALRTAGVRSFAYGFDEVDAMLAALGANLRHAFLSRPHVAHDFIPCLRSHCPTATIIYDMVDFHSLRIEREAAIKHDTHLLAAAEEIKAMEVAAARAADITIAISNEEKSAVLDLVPSAVVDVLPNIFTMTAVDPPGIDKRNGLFFVGGFWHKPNIDAVTWFVEKIWPQIRGEFAECRFRIAGSYPSDEVLALAKTPGVEVLGFVPDLMRVFSGARVFVAPLRYGAGVKGKVGQSLALGLPVVTTSIGAEGMTLIDGEHALIADDPAAFASQVMRLLRDDALWARLQTQGRSLARSTFSVDAVRGKVTDLFHV